MTYMRVELGFPGHEKAIKAGGNAIWMWLAMKAYAKEKGTNGRVPSIMIGRLQGPKPSQQRSLLKKLIAARLVDEKDGDFWMHDYLHWEESAEQAEAKKAAIRERKRRYDERVKANKERARNASGNGVTEDNGNAVTNASGNAEVTSGGNGTKPNQTKPNQTDLPPYPPSCSCPPDLTIEPDKAVGLEMNLGIPEGLLPRMAGAIVARWASDPDKRYPTVVRWRQALVSAVTREWSDPDRRKRWKGLLEREPGDDESWMEDFT